MGEYGHFIQAHPLLVGAWVLVSVGWLGFELWARFRGPRQMSAAEVVRLLNADQIHLFDIRSLDAYQKGHIAGAMHVPASQWAEIAPKYTDDKLKVLVCERGQQAWSLACRSPKTIAVLDQGMQGWLSDALPVVKGSK